MCKILVIDDDITVQIVLQDLLETEGHEVAIAADGQEGLQQAKLMRPDLIICDWMMPAVDGLEVCKQVKADPNLTTTFFILLTAREQVTDRVKGLDTGADDFVSKPIDSDELLARVRSGLRLSKTLQDLQQTQAQLVQSEKMSSIGQLVAGIAHEINNPVTFIYSNLTHVNGYTKDLLELVELYQQEVPHPSEAIADKLEAIDLTFLVKDLPKVMASMQNGSERIRQIISSLQEFTRVDRAGWKKFDIHQGIDNTLLILGHRLQSRDTRPEIQVIKAYGKVPAIASYGERLNQAFLNLLNNAIDAIEAQQNLDSKTPPRITIRTQLVHKNKVLIVISDNGIGMETSVKTRIFDPFFTSKPVGSGTGLGLSTTYQIIVQQHHGAIACKSQPGQGTEFAIELPLDSSN
ncbi:sensor histidine kinase [Phormidium sp. CCY1219]|uniref:sensor histidine kinase n=1 Tax=Phormidium sp. CCY1219 TaxID=2886104 RepID=UPI002D1EB42C|nr:response regulator [Phormidium sp. CCY1219]MEB3829911.1 response regulator [Phormidium sp. CCY1219]